MEKKGAWGNMDISEEKVSKLLKKLPEEDIPEGFSFTLHQKLKEEAKRDEQEQVYPQKGWREVLFNIFRRPQFVLAFSAVCIALLISPLFFKSQGAVSVTLYGNKPSKQIAVGEVALLRVEFRAAKDIEDVTFKVELPEGVAFVSAHEVIAESRALAFHGDLKKQAPVVIPVAVRITEEGSKAIKVKATNLGEKKIILKGKAS